jgi:hypothetical protein
MADEASVLDESVEPAAALWPETDRFEHPVEAVLDVFWQGRLRRLAEVLGRGAKTQQEPPPGSPPPSNRATRAECSKPPGARSLPTRTSRVS